jgi:peptidoglycan hydrolase-like protein with peptidoglycan-binding domain
VTRTTLVDYETVSGELGYGDATAVSAKGGGGTVTWLPALGATVKRGQQLWRADDEPVVLLYGALPMYRPLASGVEGADVKQFEENLKALGYTGFTVDDSFSSSTSAAVRDWQEDLGLAETGRVEPAQVVYASREVRISALTAHVGDSAAGPVLSYTGSTRLVTIDLAVNDQRLATKGATATVTLPDGSTVDGVVASVGTVATAASNSNGQDQAATDSTIEVIVTVADQKALGTLEQGPVDVRLVAEQRENVLTVPVAALVALREGGYGVQVVEGSIARYVAVEVGMFANGRVEVRGAGLAPGTQVGIPK